MTFALSTVKALFKSPIGQGGYNSPNGLAANYFQNLPPIRYYTYLDRLGRAGRHPLFLAAFCMVTLGILCFWHYGVDRPCIAHRLLSYINAFQLKRPPKPNVIIRQSLWVGVYGATLAWLQLGRLVTLYVILGLAGGLIAAEYFIRIREKANRRIPAQTDDDSS